MKAMRILYVINSLEGGGAASPIPAIMRVLSGAGADVRLLALTRRNGKALPPIIAAGIDHAIRAGGEKDHLAALNWLIDEARAWGATHIWTSLTRATLLGQIAGKRLGLPVISWQHNAFLKPANAFLLRRMQRMAKLWVADSSIVADLTRERLAVEADRVINWPIFYADPDAPQAKPWQPGEAIRIGSLGRLHAAKGYDVLIEALNILYNNGLLSSLPLDVTIGGEGADQQALLAALDLTGLTRVSFVGFTADPKAFLASQHLYLQPSRREGFCIAAHEAMQAALPVIVSDTGQMARSVTPGMTGHVVPVADAASLAEALRLMLSAPDQLAAMGQAARQKVLRDYSWDQFNAIGAGIIERLRNEA